MENSHTIEHTLDSREMAEMVEKEHKKLLRDIRRYITQLSQSNIAPVDFFLGIHISDGAEQTASMLPHHKERL